MTPLKATLELLLERQNLTEAQASELMISLTDSSVAPAMAGAFAPVPHHAPPPLFVTRPATTAAPARDRSLLFPAGRNPYDRSERCFDPSHPRRWRSRS